MGIFLLVAGKLTKELLGARLGDGAQVGDDFVAIHTDTVVTHHHRFGVGVETDTDLQLAVAFEQLGLVERFEAQLVAGVRSIGNQFAQEDLAVRIQRMDHQVQQLLHLGLKIHLLCLGAGRVGHRWLSVTQEMDSFNIGAA